MTREDEGPMSGDPIEIEAEPEVEFPSEGPPPLPPAAAERYRAALRQRSTPDLAQILQSLGSPERYARSAELIPAIDERLGEVRSLEGVIAGLGDAARMALGLFAVTENAVWPRAGLDFAMSALGTDSGSALAELTPRGLVLADRDGESDVLVAHPAILSAARTVLPSAPPPPSAGSARQVRASDGLEPVIRTAKLWQIVEEAALRRTQQGALYKRDRERIEDDPVLAGPIADAFEPLPDPATLWLALARGVGLIIDEADSDRTVAAPADYWADHAVHLPQMLATRWLGIRSWHETGGQSNDDAPLPPSTPYLRVAALLWLAAAEPEGWVALDDLAAHLEATFAGWSAPFLALAASPAAEGPPPSRIGPEARARSNPRGKRASGPSAEIPSGPETLAAILLGPAYQLGLVRAAEEDPSGRRLVALTELGRYALAVGRPPAPRETFDYFLFVQPNFQVIAYRQGLNAPRIGQLSRFTTWTQSGAALEMKLTAESVYRGLEGGLTPDAMLDRLARHSARPLPTSVAEALKTWAGRRERVTYFASATLVEFASPEALEAGLAAFPPGDGAGPVRVSDRVLLVEDEATIPFGAFKLAGSRDYTRPPEVCVEVEPDGVTLALDLGRSDLFIDAELVRFADPLAEDGRGGASRRRYRVSPESLRRAVEDGMTPGALARWFVQRVDAPVPPAVRLLLHAAMPNPEPPRASRRVVLAAPSADLLEGMLQHPATRGLFAERLGPATAVVPEENLAALRQALADFGLAMEGP